MDRVHPPVTRLYTHRRREISCFGKPLLGLRRSRKLAAVRHGTGNRAQMLVVKARADGEPARLGCRTIVRPVLSIVIGESLTEHVVGLHTNETITAQHLDRWLASPDGLAPVIRPWVWCDGEAYNRVMTESVVRIPVSYSLPRTNAKVLALLQPHLSSAAVVLDVGAGEGYLAQRVHAVITEYGLSARLEACDLFPDNFSVPGVRCRPIDLDGGLPWPDASVDLAYSVEVLEHLEDQFAFLREVQRVLRPGGRFVVTTPNVLSLTSRLRTLLVGFPELFGPLPLRSEDPQHLGGHIHPVSVYFISYMVEKAGLRVAGLHIDRVKSGSVGALVLWPLLALASLLVSMRVRRKEPAIYAENRTHLRRINSLRVLTGRTIILDLVKEGAGVTVSETRLGSAADSTGSQSLAERPKP